MYIHVWKDGIHDLRQQLKYQEKENLGTHSRNSSCLPTLNSKEESEEESGSEESEEEETEEESESEEESENEKKEEK